MNKENCALKLVDEIIVIIFDFEDHTGGFCFKYLSPFPVWWRGEAAAILVTVIPVSFKDVKM